MAAVLQPHHSDLPVPSRRPHLVVVPGGRAGAPAAAPADVPEAPLVRPTPLRPSTAPAVEADRLPVLRRLAAVVAAAAVVVLGVVALSQPVVQAAPSAPSAVAAAGVGHHLVQSGETLWSVAAGLHLGGDVRDVVDELAEANGGYEIRAGQVLEIPADLGA